MSKNEALKKLREIMAEEDPVIIFTQHAEREMINDQMTHADALNVLKSTSCRLTDGPESKNGTVRYRFKTWKYCVVVVFFRNADGVTVVTVWKITKE